MSEAAQKGARTTYRNYNSSSLERHMSGWVGWVGFGGAIMILSGIFQGIAGLVGIFRDTFYVVNNESQLLVFNSVDTWGWVNLLVGILVVMAGIYLFTGSMWARVIAVLFAMGSAVVNLINMPLYPVWSIICMALSIVVMYAVIAHGDELSEE